MSKSSPILGKKIKAMTDGGWELSGTVTHDKSDRVVLKAETGEILLVFKKKISAILLLSESEIKKVEPTDSSISNSINGSNFVLFKPAKRESSQEAMRKMEEDLSEGGISLPHEVLNSIPMEHNFRGSDDNDFSISMSSLRGSGRVSVTSDDKSK